LVYIPDSSLTLGGIVRGLLYRTLTRSRALTVVAAQRHECNCAVVALTKRAGGRIVTLDSSYADSLKAVGIAARSVVPGVDRSHFRRCTDVEKRAAKETLGLDARDRCVLHLGHLNKQRHLDILVTLAEACKARVVMVAGSAVPGDDSVVQQLVDAGVLLVRRDFSDIRDVYCAADVYVFPTLTGGGAIGFPLSVLEALSVGLPVVSTPFNDLPGAFPEGSGVTYAQTTDEFALQVNTILTSTTTPAPSENRLRAWDEVLQEIVYG
jgi:glycosyltransferase involved in cell wall biosynthesis